MNILEIEQAFLGCLLLNPNLIDKYEWVTNEYFQHEDSIDIYDAIKHTNNDGTDIVLVARELERGNKLNKIGGPEFLTELIEHPIPEHIMRYSELLKKEYQKKRILKVIKDASYFLKKEEEDPIQTLHDIELELREVLNTEKKDESEYLLGNIISKEKSSDDKVIASTRFKRFNKYLQGNRDGGGSPKPGHIWVIGGYTNTGKTMFTLQLIHDFAAQGKSSKLYSYEMEESELAKRLQHINNNTNNKIDLENSKISLMSPNNNSISFVKSDILDTNYDFYIIDYLGLLSEKGMLKQQIYEESVMIFKNIARKKKCCIILLSQVNRESARNESQNVMGFMGSSNIEAACDLGIILKRDFDKERMATSNIVDAMLYMPKFRHGPKASISLAYNIETGLYHNPLDIQEEEIFS